jgi:hypothetical protein
MLHTSVGSLNSSTSSLHRRRLGEIAEDIEEGDGERRKSGLRHSVLSDADSGFNEGKSSLAPQAPNASSQSLDSHLLRSNQPSTPASQISEVPPIPTFDKSLPATPADTPRSIVDGKVTVGEAKGAIEELSRPRLDDQRPSLDAHPSTTQSARLFPGELGATSPYSGYTPYKPKVKLGPRPSAQRPRTSASTGEARPISNLPNSVRISNRPPSSTSRPPSSASHRPISQQSNRSAQSHFITYHDPSPPPPLPQPSIHISALYQPPNTYLLNRPASPALSATPSIASSFTHSGPPAVPPEKQRLMRALQLRKKQQRAKDRQTKSSSPHTPAEDTPVQEIFSLRSDLKSNQATENIIQQNPPHPAQAVTPTSQKPISSEDTRQAKSNTEAPHVVAESINPYQLDSSLDSNDMEAISSAMESDSDTSDGTLPSLKSNKIVQSRSPVLPPIALQNRLSIGVSSPPPQQDLEKALQTDPVLDATKCTEGKEKCGVSLEFSGTEPKTALLTAPINEPSPQTAADALDNAAEASSSFNAVSNTFVEEKPDVPKTSEESCLQSPDQRSRSRGRSESQKAVTSPEVSDTSDNESLYDEIQTATVEQAKPVFVARSPINAVFNRGSPDRQREHNRSISILSRKTDESPKSTPEKANADVVCSSSSAIPQWLPTVEPAQSLLINKTTVSSGISKRIRALEMFSGRSDAAAGLPNSVAPPSPPLTAGLVKKRLSSHSPNDTLARNLSTSTPPAKQLNYPSPAPTPTPAQVAGDRSPWLQWTGSNTEILPPRRKGDSMSVTARIIRDPIETKSKDVGSPSTPVTMNLHRSPLVVEHAKAEPVPEPIPEKDVESNEKPIASKEPDLPITETPKSERRRLSLSSIYSNSGKMAPSESFTKRLSMTIRHGRAESANVPRSASESSSITEDKITKESRKIRLMKRMSVLTAGSRRSLASAFGSNTLRQEEPASGVSQPPESIAERSGESSPGNSSMAESYAHVVDIGDVNIQFPDTLLWKRRFMRIDDQGFLILTPPTMEVNKRGVSRRFHLSDIKKPCLPPLEREELPWSIVLDFEDGSCLQCACESRYAQGQVLRSRSLTQIFFGDKSANLLQCSQMHTLHIDLCICHLELRRNGQTSSGGNLDGKPLPFPYHDFLTNQRSKYWSWWEL